MDTLADREVESIWQRVKQYIPTDRITGNSKEEVLQSIDKLMSEARDPQDDQGSMDSLLRNGFATKKGFGRTKEFQSKLDNWVVAGAPKREAVQVFEEPSLDALPKLNIFSSGRASVSTGRGKRVFSQKNLRVSFSRFKGKQSYYIYNTRTKKRVSWGVL